MKIVVFGGGTGLSILLRGLKKFTNEITAVVTVADNGGGSGVLREDLGMLPPGDMRNCIVALSDIEHVMVELLQHRFREGSLKGQSFGNLFIAAMYEFFGDFEHALKEIGNIFRLSGKVLPMTLEDANLEAELINGEHVYGEKNIPDYVRKTNNSINKIHLIPDNCRPVDETILELNHADFIILGPGSLYTSVIPNLLIDDIPSKIKKSKAKTIYICNVMTQPGETDKFNVKQHLDAICSHINDNIIDYVLVNNKSIPDDVLRKYRYKGAEQVIFDNIQKKQIERMGIKVISDNFLDIEKNYVRHDSVKIGKTLLNMR